MHTTRERILNTATRLFDERGFDGVSVRDIVREADVNLGAVTYHFRGKEGLFAAVIARKLEPLRRRNETALNGLGTPREKLSELLFGTALYVFHEEPTMKALIVETLEGGQRLPSDGVDFLRWRHTRVKEVIQEGVDRGEFRPCCDLNYAAWTLMGLLLPYALYLPAIRPEQKREPYTETFIHQAVDAALDLFFHGLTRRTEGESP